MIKLQIVNKNDYMYELEGFDKQQYCMNLEFLDMEENLKEGDYIFFSEELLDSKYEGYSTTYTFGNLENKYGKINISIDDSDVIKIVIDEKEIYLKRLYG